MNSSVYKISLDIHTPESQETLEMKHLDSKRKIHISLTENGKVYQITPDCKAMFSAEKSDDNKVYNQCEIDGNTIIYDVTQQTLACVGEVDCEIQLVGGDDAIITSPRFSIIVHDRVYNGEDIVDSEMETDVLPGLIAKSHSHDNKNTLDGFFCEAAENVPPEGDFPVGGGSVKSSRLNYGNEAIRYVSDGDVITSVEKTDSEIKINLAPIDMGNGVTIPKDPIVIPLGGNSGNTGGGLTPEQAADLEANTASRHKHSNKIALDNYSEQGIGGQFLPSYDMGSTYDVDIWTSYSGSIVQSITKNDETGDLTITLLTQRTPVFKTKSFTIVGGNKTKLSQFENDVPYVTSKEYEVERDAIYESINNVIDVNLADINTRIDGIEGGDNKIKLTEETATLQPNVYYSFDEMTTLTLEFAKGNESKVNEYMFGFVSGETPTVLTLPDTVKWANELTIEANKRYEISIVDNIGLWCAVEVSV